MVDEITVEDVRTALKTCAVEHGKDTAKGILAMFGGAQKVADVPPSQYAGLMEALENYDLIDTQGRVRDLLEAGQEVPGFKLVRAYGHDLVVAPASDPRPAETVGREVVQ